MKTKKVLREGWSVNQPKNLRTPIPIAEEEKKMCKKIVDYRATLCPLT
jgi:hypothetical protein